MRNKFIKILEARLFFNHSTGPNGAGKSNMMDAISFVLGVQSRFLRSSNLKELVFRKDAQSPPVINYFRSCFELLFRWM